jgi:hypothetical protein
LPRHKQNRPRIERYGYAELTGRLMGQLIDISNQNIFALRVPILGQFSTELDETFFIF